MKSSLGIRSFGNLREVQEALDGHGSYCVASGLYLDPRVGKGAFCLH